MKLLLSSLAAALILGIIPAAAQAQTFNPASVIANPSDLSQYTTADSLWLRIQDLKKGPGAHPASAGEYHTVMLNLVAQLTAATVQFLTTYPDDPRAWDARLLQIETANTLNTLEGRQDDAALSAQLQELAGRQDAPSSVRAEARYQLLAASMRAYLQKDPSVTADSVIAQLNQFISDFPTYPSLDALKYKVAQTLGTSDPAAADTLLTQLADSGEGQIADQARKQLATREKLKSPLDLRFTAVDGSPVDLSTMRGKVVLVDFWATWCGPCRAELPNVLAAYNKLHDSGFEVVGISLDQDQNKLVNFTAANGMTWPQYFDGKGWQNTISSGFGILSIPTMWLVNKKGYVVSTNGRADLEAQVEKLLAESGE